MLVAEMGDIPMKTKQGWFLVGVNVIISIVAIRWFVTNYPAIFFFILAGVNIGLILVFTIWNRLRADTDSK